MSWGRHRTYVFWGERNKLREKTSRLDGRKTRFWVKHKHRENTARRRCSVISVRTPIEQQQHHEFITRNMLIDNRETGIIMPQ